MGGTRYEQFCFFSHIRIYTKRDISQLVNYYYGCYDSLQYSMLFFYDQNEWHYDIQKNKFSFDSFTVRIYNEHDQLSSVKNMASIDEFLSLEDEAMRKG